MEGITLSLLVQFLAIRSVFGSDGFLTQLVPSYPMCEFLCLYSAKCGSFTWDVNSRRCQLHTRKTTGKVSAFALKYKYQLRKGICGRHFCSEYDMCVPVEAGEASVCLPVAASPNIITTTTTTTTKSITTTSTSIPNTTATTLPTNNTTTPTATTTTTITITTTSITTTTTTTPTSTTSITTTTTTPTTTTPITTTTTTPTTTTSITTTTTTLTSTTTLRLATTTTATATATTITPITSTTSTTQTTTVTYVYEGCFRDDRQRLLPHAKAKTKKLTADWCFQHCVTGATSTLAWRCQGSVSVVTRSKADMKRNLTTSAETHAQVTEAQSVVEIG